jgi:hypothetical protein
MKEPQIIFKKKKIYLDKIKKMTINLKKENFRKTLKMIKITAKSLKKCQKVSKEGLKSKKD